MGWLGKRFETAIHFQNGSIGDFLMSIFLAGMLKKSGYVDRVVIVVPRNCNWLRGLLSSYPYITAVEVSRYRGWLQLIKIIRQPCLVVLQPALGKIPLRVKVLGWSISRGYGSALVGFQDKSPICKALYSKTLVYDTDRLYSENIQNIMRVLDRQVLVDTPALKINPTKDIVRTFGLAYTPYIVFHPGASSSKRAFTPPAAKRLIEHVLERNSEMHVVLSGSTAEANYIGEIRRGIEEQQRVLMAIGRSAQEIATLIRFAQFFVGSDTGITHLACFLRAPVIVTAHCGAANWLPFYCPTATVLYRLEDEDAVHRDRDYLEARRRGRIKPLGKIPVNAICGIIDEWLDSRAEQPIGSSV